MTTKWKINKEQLLRGMKISPTKKMEWLREAHEFFSKASSKKTLRLRRQLRELGNR